MRTVSGPCERIKKYQFTLLRPPPRAGAVRLHHPQLERSRLRALKHDAITIEPRRRLVQEGLGMRAEPPHRPARHVHHADGGVAPRRIVAHVRPGLKSDSRSVG